MLKKIFVVIVGVLVIALLVEVQKYPQRITSRAAEASEKIKGPGNLINPSGEAMPTADLPNWRLVFTDDFKTNVPLGSFPQAISDKWGAYPDGWTAWSAKAIAKYRPSKTVSVENGVLRMYLHPAGDGTYNVAAILPKIKAGTSKTYGSGLTYGRYAIRMRAPKAFGYYVASLLWPDSETWPRDGEIDWPEGYLTFNMFPHLHRRQDGPVEQVYNINLGVPESGIPTDGKWHTYVLEWKPGVVQYYYDGKFHAEGGGRIPSKPMHWVIQTTYMYEQKAQGPATIEIDWVAVWEKTLTDAAHQ